VTTGVGLDDRGKVIRFPKGAVDVSIHESVQIDAQIFTATYSVDVAVYCPDLKWSGNAFYHLPHLVLGFRIRGTLMSLPYALMAETLATTPLQV
jgi:hypothetical protein